MIKLLIIVGFIFIIIKFKVYNKVLPILKKPYDKLKFMYDEEKFSKQNLSYFNKMRKIELKNRRW